MNFVQLVQLILVLAILSVVGLPLFRGLSTVKLFAKLDKAGEEYKHLLVRKEEVLLSIKDLEFDLKTDKISEEDYQGLRNKLEMDAVALLERLEELEKEKQQGKKSSKPAKVV
jgi:hypothetical protein